MTISGRIPGFGALSEKMDRISPEHSGFRQYRVAQLSEGYAETKVMVNRNQECSKEGRRYHAVHDQGSGRPGGSLFGICKMKVLDFFGDPAKSEWTIIQPVDDHDRDLLPQEMLQIRNLCQGGSFAAIPVHVNWFQELPPWTAPAAFRGQSDFGNGAAETLEKIIKEVVPAARGKRILGGYSLAGFFALWAGYQTDLFDGIVAASPSVWYPGWDTYAETHACQIPIVYLSLGKQEEATRNPVMRTVGDRIREQYRLLQEQNVQTVLEWNPGNHFRDPGQRTAAGFAWIMKNARN